MGAHVNMPSLGMAMEEGRVIAWRVKEGDVVASGQILVEIESDKTAFELEAPTDGTIDRILVPDDTVVPVGTALCSISTGDDAQKNNG